MEAQRPLSGPAHPSFRPALMQCESLPPNLELNLRRPHPQPGLAGSGARGRFSLGH